MKPPIRRTIIALTLLSSLAASCYMPQDGSDPNSEATLEDEDVEVSQSAIGTGAKPYDPSKSIEFINPVYKPRWNWIDSTPEWHNTRLDWCRDWGTNCGQPAADAYCQRLGFERASSFAKENGVRPTLLADGTTKCDSSTCDSFASIICQGNPWTATRRAALADMHELGAWTQGTHAFRSCVDFKMRTRYKDCKYDAWSSEADEVQIAKLIATARTTPEIEVNINWNPNDTGSGSAGVQPYDNTSEIVTLDVPFFWVADTSASSLQRSTSGFTHFAGTLWHENTHRHGYRDPVNPNPGAEADAAAAKDTCGRTVKLSKPMLQGKRVDYCHTWATDCGQKAADEYCKIKGHTKAVSFERERAVGDTKLVTGPRCYGSCTGFASIECEKDFGVYLSEDEQLPDTSWDHASYAVGNCLREAMGAALGKTELKGQHVNDGQMRVFGPFKHHESAYAAATARLRSLSSAANADLYVKRDAQPTTTSYDCRSTMSAPFIDECALSSTGSYYIGVYGVDSVDFDLAVIWEKTPLAYDAANQSVGLNQWDTQIINTSGPAYIRLTTHTGNADLYVKSAMAPTAPTTTNYTVRSLKPGLGEDRLYVKAGTHNIGVHGKAASTYSIEVDYIE